MKVERKENAYFTDLGNEIIQTDEALKVIANSEVRILFMESDRPRKSHGRLVFGACEKVSDKNKCFIDADFIITLYKDNLGGFKEEQLQILLLHELLHIGVEYTQKEEWRYFLKPHDIEEFSLIEKRYGLDWADTQLKLDFGMQKEAVCPLP